jgi:hypothetical protein
LRYLTHMKNFTPGRAGRAGLRGEASRGRLCACAAIALACAAATGCSAATGDSTGAGGDGATFLPFTSDFEGYPSWKSYSVPHGPGPDNVHDPDAPLVAYINQLPPPGATEFPVGTIIVKEVATGDEVGRTAFSMAKRGGGYNAAGAVDWEWLELTRLADDMAQIDWSGTGPMGGSADPYAGDPEVCNGCHVDAVGNDYVWSTPLNLTTLEASE